MYKVLVVLMVKGKYQKQMEFDCKSIKKDIIQQNICRLTKIEIDSIELVYLDSQKDQICLSSIDDYTIAQLQTNNANNILQIVAKTDKQLPFGNKEHKQSIAANKKLQKLQKCMKDQFNKGDLNKKAKQFIQIKNDDQLKNQSNDMQLKLAEVYPKMTKKQRRKMETQIMKDDLRVLKANNHKNSKDQILIEKKEEIKQKPVEVDLKDDDGQVFSFEQIEDSQKDEQQFAPCDKGYIKMLNYVQKLKRGLKQQILAQLPNYLKKQCFNVIPYQVNKIAQEPLCFSCQKKLKQLPLPIYINNKNQFYCIDCEEYLADDDQLLVKIKSEKLRDQIFMVKCVPVLRNQIQHLQKINYSSKQQKYLQIVKQSKRITIQKLNHFIFKQQERTIMHNRLMKSQERTNQFRENNKRKRAKEEHRLNKQKHTLNNMFMMK